MLSDEEKGELEKIAMLELNRFIYGKHLSEGDIKDNLSILFEIIKKQSKEIEELKDGQIDFWISDKEIEERIRNKFVSKEESEQKEKKAYIDGTNIADELCNKYWQDKIKAKIEEQDETKQYWTDEVKDILKSLLRKE